MQPWQHWYHLTLTAYGQWLPGDPRSWRPRDHKYHVPGDYKNPPPPSKFATNLQEHAKELLKNDPILFHPSHQPEIGNHILTSLQIQKIPTHRAAVSTTHVHLLIQCPSGNPKTIAGKCKQNVTRRLPCPAPSGWWAIDCGVTPINDHAHFLNAAQYILDHAEEGAWTWQPQAQGLPPPGTRDSQ